MPKELFEIKGFHKGIDSSTSAEDIAQDSAAHSLNIDCTARDGALVGVPADKTLTTTNLPTNVNLDSVARVDKSVVAFCENGDVYKASEDNLSFQNQGSLGFNVTPTSFEPHNRELHIGTGSNPPQWTGYRKNNATDEYEFYVENAELKKPGGDNFNSPFTKVIKHSNDNTYAYAFRRGGSEIYRIKLNDGVITKNVVNLNFAIQDLCENISDSSSNKLLALEKSIDVVESVGKLRVLDTSSWGSQLEVATDISDRPLNYATDNIPNFTGGSYNITDRMEATEILETGSAAYGYVLWIQLTHDESDYNGLDHGIRPRVSDNNALNRYLFACTYVHSGTNSIDLTDQSMPLNYVDEESQNGIIYFKDRGTRPNNTTLTNGAFNEGNHPETAYWRVGYTSSFTSLGVEYKRDATLNIPVDPYWGSGATDNDFSFTVSKTFDGAMGWYNNNNDKVRFKSVRNTLVATDSDTNKVGYLLYISGHDGDSSAPVYLVTKKKFEFICSWTASTNTHSMAQNYPITKEEMNGMNLIETKYRSNGRGSEYSFPNTGSEYLFWDSTESVDSIIDNSDTPPTPTDDTDVWPVLTSWERSIKGFSKFTNRLTRLSEHGSNYNFIAHNISDTPSKVQFTKFATAGVDFSSVTTHDVFNYDGGDINHFDNRIINPFILEYDFDNNTAVMDVLVFDREGDLKVISQEYDIDKTSEVIDGATTLLSRSASAITLSSSLEYQSQETNPNFPDVASDTTPGVRFYKTSLTYDGYQESPLSNGRWSTSALGTSSTTYGIENLKVRVSLEVGKFNVGRASHVNIYRADEPNFPYRLVKKLMFNRDFLLNVEGTHYIGTYVDIKTEGATYEAITGLSESLDRSIINYTISTQVNSSMIIGGCYHPTNEDDFSRFLFKSKENRFDTFDWTTDFCMLPEEPVALSNYKGRIYAFSKNTMYRINPNGLYIEDTFEGIGCINKDCVTTTDYGMFWADHKNIYLFTGQGMNPIGVPILKGGSNFNADWSSYWHKMNKLYPDYKFKTIFDPSRLSFMILGTTVYQNNPGEETPAYNQKGIAWSYHVLKKRWDLIEYPTNQRLTTTDIQDYADVVQFQDNSVVFFRSNSDGNPVVEKYLQGDTKRNWEWISKDITMGLDSQDKFLYKIKATYENTKPKVYYWINTGRDSAEDATLTEITETAETFNNTDNTGLFNAKVSTRRARSIQLELRSDNDTEVKSCGVVYRRRSIR